MPGGIGLGLGLGISSIDLERPSPTTITSSPVKNVKATHPAYKVDLPARSHRGPRSLGIGKRFVSQPSHNLPCTIYDKSTSNPLSVPPSSTSETNPTLETYANTVRSYVNHGERASGSGSGIIFNSPQLGLDLVNINPTQHLRQMKKRSFLANHHNVDIRKKNFGLNSNDPLNNVNFPPSTSSSLSAQTSSSPTIGSSPTLSSSTVIGGSPIITNTSSPIPENHHHNNDMLIPSIALSIVLGILVLSVASWVGIHYNHNRRKRLMISSNQGNNDDDDEEEEEEEEGGGERNKRQKDIDEKSFISEMFNASNVVEKGLKPKSKSSSKSTTNTSNSMKGNAQELRSSFISYKRPLSSVHPGNNNTHTGRRVSFVDHSFESDQYDQYHQGGIYYQDQNDNGTGNGRESFFPPPRVMIASLHQPEYPHYPDSHQQQEVYEEDGAGEEVEEVEEEDMEHPLPSPRSSIAPTLEMIEEEDGEDGSIRSASSNEGKPTAVTSDEDREEMQYASCNPISDRRDSIESSSNSSTCSGDYTTASARSSISSLSALSVLSSSFPQTPREDVSSTPPPRESGSPSSMIMTNSELNPNSDTSRSASDSPSDRDMRMGMGMSIYDSPTPTSKFQSRRKRAQSQGGVGIGVIRTMEVKHDLLRTAVGRTMSLQPTREVRELVRIMTSQVDPLPLPLSSNPRLKISSQGKEYQHNTEEEQGEDVMEEIRVAALISAQLEEQVTIQQQQHPVEVSTNEEEEEEKHDKLARSTSFPSKLLSRRKSAHTNTTTTTEGSSPSRKSEIISNGYLKRALKAFKGEGEDNTSISIPIVPTNIPIASASSLHKKENEETIKQLAERQIQLEKYLSLIQCQGQEIHDQTQTHGYNQDTEYEGGQNPYEENMEMEVEVQDVDSIWDSEAYSQYNGADFEDYYIHFEGNDDDDDYDNNDQHDREEEQEAYTDMQYEERNCWKDDTVPHIKVTSH
ncbi:uncharacterized protein IL334_002635 [Kwoniella shivajii]|uniref:Uncharacterized protein n=1 Tax=Kwoniella shivajii TaxID=564305 RepID=A0ABZ1CX04_9TREE|nr:hypothetical protein IL334_002635 [Kwoniella shivajii]